MFQNVYLTNKLRKKRIRLFILFLFRNMKKDLSVLFSNINYFIDVIPKNVYPYRKTKLCSLFQKYHSDKGSFVGIGMHNYSTIYDILFNDFIGKKISLFEMGIGTLDVNIQSNMGRYGKPGASLFAWREYFVNAIIFAADIDKSILFNDQNISTFYCDQTSAVSIKNLIVKIDFKKFDVVIDDGLHTFDANVCFFEHSIHKLNPNGYYIIEDITNHDSQLFVDKIKEWEVEYKDHSFTMLTIPNGRNNYDNRLIVVHKLACKVERVQQPIRSVLKTL
jgi:hypothetical protein